MSQNNLVSTGEFQYTPSNNFTTLQNVYVPPSNSLENLVLELCDEIKSLKNEIKELKDGNKRSFTKLTEEVIAVKLENRKHHNDILTTEIFEAGQNLPLAIITDLERLDEEIQKNEAKLMQFKEFVAKTGGEGHTQFLRVAVRKIFSDELASAYSWKGTGTKPSAEKCFLITTIKNICHLKYKCTDKEMNTVLQQHFVHAKDRVMKRKRPNT